MRFESSFIGPQQLTAADLTDAGSRYADIRDACFQNAYYLTWGAEGEPPLPVYDVSLGRVIKGFLPGGRKWRFLQSAGRTLDSSADMRWGKDGRGFRRLLHPNGVCLFGRWIIDQPSPYSGYFRQGSDALIIGRYSVCCSETRRGCVRSLSLVGKLFPTKDPDHPGPLRTANFITQEDIGGARTLYVNDALLRNAPDVTPWRRGLGLPVLVLTGLAFKLVDREPTIRQLYPVAELGKDVDTPTRAPRFMQLRIAEDQPQIPGEHLDFRNEILAQIYDRGDPAPKRTLVFTIEVCDESEGRGSLTRSRTFGEWRKIGRIEFTEGVASYNGDFVLHFPHPPWRKDPDKPETVVRRSRQ